MQGPVGEAVPHVDARVAQKPVHLLDRLLGYKLCASAWPIIATASEAPVIMPSVAPARASIRSVCRSGPYSPPMNPRIYPIYPALTMLRTYPSITPRLYRAHPNRGYASVSENEGLREPNASSRRRTLRTYLRKNTDLLVSRGDDPRHRILDGADCNLPAF